MSGGNPPGVPAFLSTAAAAVVALLRRVGLWGRGLVIAAPYLWLFLFFLVPFLIVFRISFSDAVIAQPPYSDIVQLLEDTDLEQWKLQITLNLSTYLRLLTDDLYIYAYLSSLKMAAVSTLLCLLLGYPMAYAIARAKPSMRGPLMMLIILPFWTSFLIRVYAWIGILKANGVLANMLGAVGLVDSNWELLYSDVAVYIGITYSYLPFMILPLYATLEKLDPVLLEAAADLGCKPWEAFLKVTLPLSLPGIVAGSLLVFIPAVGEFVIPELLGGPDTLMIGRVLWNEFFSNRDWPVASAVAIALLLFLVVPIMVFQYVQARQQDGEERR
ncbi:ABC transporter permease subunit [Azospirillum sp. RWY-5-1]|uniref:ABC transporter permease subunit n=1 Tax=Azospirillum oleiclasticum TaxID=2735135 RepID=A0ABX2TEX2_9PROT|nr:ABC transporter permease subunit [Azospirillum oleiclasticum]NYZ15129.1 ABC transporter permease subunit [Azospirillum oleiclasticum]NYZ22892.1 ABC transporter permease subunit [Azospirillum oleiclasticum]